MKKSMKKPRGRKPRPIASKAGAPGLIDPDALRNEIKNLVYVDAVRMVSKTIAQVGNGHYQGMKYLFEMIGLFPATAAQDAHNEDSLTKMLLSRLGIHEGTFPEAPVTKNQS